MTTLTQPPVPQSIPRNSVFLSAKSCSANDYAHPLTVTSVFYVSRHIDMVGKHLLCPAHSFRTSCRLLHKTHRTASNEHWTRPRFLEWASCCRSQHLWGTFLRAGKGRGTTQSITLTLTLTLDGSLWLAASYQFPHIVHAQYYANEGCKTCAGLLASFITLVIWVLKTLPRQSDGRVILSNAKILVCVNSITPCPTSGCKFVAGGRQTSRLIFIIIGSSACTQRLRCRTLTNEALADICGFINPLCAYKRPWQMSQCGAIKLMDCRL